MELVRRAATEADKPFVWQANARAYEEVVTRQFGEWDAEQQESKFDDKWRCAAFEVVELGGERVGAIWTTDEGDHLWLREVFLLPNHQQQGIGTGLVKQEIVKARRLSKPLRLRVLRESRARALYTRLGFSVCGETETHFWMEAI
jgi:GNAT superfamily N-acetyltransferase